MKGLVGKCVLALLAGIAVGASGMTIVLAIIGKNDNSEEDVEETE